MRSAAAAAEHLAAGVYREVVSAMWNGIDRCHTDLNGGQLRWFLCDRDVIMFDYNSLQIFKLLLQINKLNYTINEMKCINPKLYIICIVKCGNHKTITEQVNRCRKDERTRKHNGSWLVECDGSLILHVFTYLCICFANSCRCCCSVVLLLWGG